MKTITKDILSVNQGVIIHCCNTLKVMGAGLALDIRKLYPQVYQAYVSKPTWNLGEVQFVEVAPKLVIANMTTQDKIGTHKRQTNFGALRKYLLQVKGYSDARELGIYCPFYLGSGLAGGANPEERKQTWETVEGLLSLFSDVVICRKP